MRKSSRKLLLSKRALSVFAFLFFSFFCSAAKSENGTLSLAIPYPISQLSHFAYDEPIQRIAFETGHVGLLNLTPEGTTRLGAATQFEILEGGKVWAFELPGLTQSLNGKPLSASDIQNSIAYLKRGVFPPGSRPDVTLQNIIQVRSTESQRRVLFELQQADLGFSSAIATLPIVDQKLIEGFGSTYGLGTQFSNLGVYNVIENRREEGFVLGSVSELHELKTHRNSKIEFRYFESPERVLRKLVYGLIDIVPLPTAQQLLEAQKDPRLDVRHSPLKALRERSLRGSATPWKLVKEFWGKEAKEEASLSTDYIIVRDDFSLSKAAVARFDLSNVTVTGKSTLP